MTNRVGQRMLINMFPRNLLSTNRLDKVQVESVAEFADPRGDLVEVDRLFAAICAKENGRRAVLRRLQSTNAAPSYERGPRTSLLHEHS